MLLNLLTDLPLIIGICLILSYVIDVFNSITYCLPLLAKKKVLVFGIIFTIIGLPIAIMFDVLQ